MDHILIPKVNDVLFYKNAVYERSFAKSANLYITTTHLIISFLTSTEEIWVLHTLIDTVEILPLDIKGCPLLVKCKNFLNFIIVLQKDSERYDLHQTLINLSRPNYIEDLPLFHNNVKQQSLNFEINLEKEYVRMGINKSHWVSSQINKNFQVCQTYPETLYVPRNSQPQTMLMASKFRSKNRLPVLTYLDRCGAALCRSSQPLSGLNARSMDDENYLTDILFANPNFEDLLPSAITPNPINSTINFCSTSNRQNIGISDFFHPSNTSSTTMSKSFQLLDHKPEHFEGPNPFSSTLQSFQSIQSNLNLVQLPLANSPNLKNTFNRPPNTCETSVKTVTDNVVIEQQHQLSTNKSKIPYMYIVDTRPKINALANRAKGAGGYENPNFYTNVKFQFCGVENIHVMRNSLQKLVSVCQSKWDNMSSYLNALQSTGWCKHIRAILVSSLLVAQILREERVNVLVHCSDGWDRTAQTVSIAQILLDPFYRTFEGYVTLIEKDWLSFGHKFSDRCAHLNGDKKEASPVFLQFLDATWQLTQFFPKAFEFNQKFLLRILDGVYSCDTATFLGNTPFWRKLTLGPLILMKFHNGLPPPSLWDDLLDEKNINLYLNPFYTKSKNNEESTSQNVFSETSDQTTSNDFLKPNICPQNIKVWLNAYARFDENMLPRVDIDDLFTEKLNKIDRLQHNLATLETEFNTKISFNNENLLTNSNIPTFKSLLQKDVANNVDIRDEKNIHKPDSDKTSTSPLNLPNGYDPLINNQIL